MSALVAGPSRDRPQPSELAYAHVAALDMLVGICKDEIPLPDTTAKPKSMSNGHQTRMKMGPVARRRVKKQERGHSHP